MTLENLDASNELAGAIRRGGTILAPKARAALRRWSEGRVRDGRASSEFRGTLYSFSPTLTPEVLSERATLVSDGDLREAFARWAGIAQ